MLRRPPGTTRTDPPFPSTRSSDLIDQHIDHVGPGQVGVDAAINTDPRAPRAIIAQQCGGAGKLAGAMDQRLHVGFDIAATVIERQPPAAECAGIRSEEHTSELQSLMRISYAVFCLNKKKVHHNSSQ